MASSAALLPGWPATRRSGPHSKGIWKAGFMDRKTVAQNLTDVIAEEIEAQVGVLRPVDQMAPLIADAILDFFEVRTREGIEFSPRGNISEQEVTCHHDSHRSPS